MMSKENCFAWKNGELVEWHIADSELGFFFDGNSNDCLLLENKNQGSQRNGQLRIREAKGDAEYKFLVDLNFEDLHGELLFAIAGFLVLECFPGKVVILDFQERIKEG